ncbi:MAG TPA: WS/DGAT domain-containing protein, partial [Rhodocyclaceae bacterium]|nr:WS/DGAT domain-containing protein [Rhodocyclaceae bacterium]
QEQPKRTPRAPLPPSVQRLTQPLFDAIRIGGEILPGVGSGLMDILRAGKSTGTMAMPFQAPPTLFNVPISESRRFAAQSYSLARLKHLGQTAGATVNDVTLAICAGALRKYLIAQNGLPEKPLIAMVPVSLHGETKKDGNQVGMILVNLATHIVDPVERLRQIVQSTTEAKLRLSKMSRLQKIAHAAAMLTPFLPSMATGHARKHPIFNVVISNVPGPTMPLYLDGAQLDELYPVSIPADYMALNITVSGYGDHLGFGFTACRRSVPVLQRMLDYTAESFVELEEALHPEALHPSETEAAPAAKPRKRKSPAKTAATRAESESV